MTSVSTTSPRPGVRLAGLADLATPARLRILNVAIGVALAVVALVWLDSMAVRLDRIDSGREAAEGVRQLQSVRDALVRADSLATAGFLEAGLDDPTRRAAYVDALDQAALELTTASRRVEGSDATLLGRVSANVGDYRGLVESARANNRQGFPVGAAYQRAAGSLLRDDILPALATADSRLRSRAESLLTSDGRALLWVVAGVVICLAAAWYANRWIRRRMRRRINIGLAGAAAVAVVGSLIGITQLISVSNTASSTFEGSFRTARLLVDARAAAFDARSAEASALAFRSSAATALERFNARIEDASSALADSGAVGAPLKEQLDDYSVRANAVEQLAADGQRSVAIAASLGEAVPESPPDAQSATAFSAFDTQSLQELNRADSATRSALDGLRGGLGWSRWAMLVAIIAAIGAATLGIAQRLREYR